jgi:hypothetical protein
MIPAMGAAELPPSFWQLSYQIAYFVLPNYAYTRLSQIEELCRNTPKAAGPFFYVMACQMTNVAPNRNDAERFSWKVGSLDDLTDYYIMVHPTPPPFDITKIPQADIGRHPLAPHFSAILSDRTTRTVQYYVLGQSPLGGGTTLRSVTINPMANSNLGPGPEPDLDAFLAAIMFRRSK